MNPRVLYILKTGGKLPPSPVEMAVLPQGSVPALVSEQLGGGGGGDWAGRRDSLLMGEAMGRCQTTGDRDTTPATRTSRNPLLKTQRCLCTT